MATTSPSQTRSQARDKAQAPPGLNTTRSTTSSVEIHGRPKRTAEKVAGNIQKKIKSARTQKEKANESVKRAMKRAMTQKENIKEAARDGVREAMEGLKAILRSKGLATTDSDARKVSAELLRANTSEEGTMSVHALFRPAFEEMDMPLIGMSCDRTDLRNNKRKLSWDDPAALPGQQFGRKALSAEQIARKEYTLQYGNGTGETVGYTEEYRSEATKLRYEIELEQGKGFAAHNEGKKLHLNKVISKACADFPEFLFLHKDKRGFDVKPLTGALKDVSLPHVLELVAKLCKQSNWKNFRKTLTHKNGEMCKMNGTRLLENGETFKTKNGKLPAEHANAGYRFVFSDNDTTFDS
eukprot:scaffold6778_cov97-Skeletonema_dohrnii-CCMP3373.AAC.4